MERPESLPPRQPLTEFDIHDVSNEMKQLESNTFDWFEELGKALRPDKSFLQELEELTIKKQRNFFNDLNK